MVSKKLQNKLGLIVGKIQLFHFIEKKYQSISSIIFLVLSQFPADLVYLPSKLTGGDQSMINFKGRHFMKDIILMVVRWYIAYSLSCRDIEELMLERGIPVDHSTVNRWVIYYSPLLENEFRKNRKRKIGASWRIDETYIKIKGVWNYLYRAVDKNGDTIDFMLSEKRDAASAKAFFDEAIGSSGLPEKVTIDKSGANKAAVEKINLLFFVFALIGLLYFQITVRQIKGYTMKLQLAEAIKYWDHISPVVAYPKNKKEFNELVSQLDALLEVVKNNEAHRLMGLVDVLSSLVSTYEDQHFHAPSIRGVGALKFLMDSHHLTQSDLPEIGSQGV